MSKNGAYRPESFCPICGKEFVVGAHHCKENTIRGIDSAELAARNAEDTTSYVRPRPTLAKRLQRGFAWMDGKRSD